MKKILLFFILFLYSVSQIGAHSAYLFGINLDFDKQLKQNIVSAAQNYAKTEKTPTSFDLDKGLIIVHFDSKLSNYVEINPYTFEVSGFRNENFKHKEGQKTITKEKGFEIAKKEFDRLPEKIKSELVYMDSTEIGNTYYYKWFRQVNGILVLAEDFFVNVDSVNGNVIAKRLSIFDYKKEEIIKNPSITKEVSRKVAELYYNSPSVEGFEPYLVINSKELVWVNRIKGQFYAYYVGVSTEDGRIVFTGILPGDVPDSYKSPNLDTVETELIKEIYSK